MVKTGFEALPYKLKNTFNMEGLCDLLYPQTGAGNYRDIPVFQQVRLTVCCRDGELAPRKT